MPYTFQHKGKQHIHEMIKDGWLIYKQANYNRSWKSCLLQALEEHRSLLTSPGNDLFQPDPEIKPKQITNPPTLEEQQEIIAELNQLGELGQNGELWAGMAGYDV